MLPTLYAVLAVYTRYAAVSHDLSPIKYFSSLPPPPPLVPKTSPQTEIMGAEGG